VTSTTAPTEADADTARVDTAAPEKPTKGELSRRAILGAAIARFGRDGFRSTSVADIARDAGVSGTLVYAHYPNKEALFLAALDHDAAEVIAEGLQHLLDEPTQIDWQQTLVVTLVDAVDRHPLARRVLAGLEPEVTDRVLDIPILVELRRAAADRLRADQAAGRVRSDIDPVVIANGIVSIVLSLLMSITQLGRGVVAVYADDVAAVFGAAIDPPAHGQGGATGRV
jgi:AcrR family transcriptional regulator